LRGRGVASSGRWTTAPDYAAVLEDQLIAFALGTKKNGLIHGDLRPWNIFFDPARGVQVIDWWKLSAFVDDLVGDAPQRGDLIADGKHYVRFHPELVAEGRFTDIDLEDARVIGKILRGEIRTVKEAWPAQDARDWYPAWCMKL
jgi:Phosphotransferase enzyme family